MLCQSPTVSKPCGLELETCALECLVLPSPPLFLPSSLPAFLLLSGFLFARLPSPLWPPLRSATLPNMASPLRRRVPLCTRSEPLSVSPRQCCPPSFSGVEFLSARDRSLFPSPLRKHFLPSFSDVGFFNTPVCNICNRFVQAVAWESSTNRCSGNSLEVSQQRSALLVGGSTGRNCRPTQHWERFRPIMAGILLWREYPKGSP